MRAVKEGAVRLAPSPVTKEQMRLYLQTFHQVYEDTAKQFLSPHELGSLLRWPYLHTQIRGYISTVLGAGFEYIPNASGLIVIETSKPIPHFIFSPSPAVVAVYTPPIGGKGTVRFNNGPVISPIPFSLAEKESAAYMYRLRWQNESGDWPSYRKWVEYLQLHGDNSEQFWSQSNAISRAKDDIIVAMNDLRQADRLSVPLYEYIKRYKEKMVLVLGDYSPEGKARLSAIKDILQNRGYDPVLVEDVPEHPDLDIPQKVTTIGSVARFVVIDDSSRSGHIYEVNIGEHNDWITVILRKEGSTSSFMTRGRSITSTVIKEQSYTMESLPAVLAKAIQWAEKTLVEVRQKRTETYIWRQQMSPS